MTLLFNFLLFNVLFLTSVCGSQKASIYKNALDLNLYESVLNPEECEKQLAFIANRTSIRNQFLDAGIRTPRGILQGNMRDMGNYFQCLEIREDVENMLIEGKYTVVQLPLKQDNFTLPEFPTNITWPDFPWPEFPWPELNPETRMLNDQKIKELRSFEIERSNVQLFLGSAEDNSRVSEGSQLSDITFELAVCIPKVCSARQALNSFSQNLTRDLEVNEYFNRLPNDKPWVAADYIAISIFSLIGLLTLISSAYDVHHSVVLKEDPKRVNKTYSMFSVFTNTRKFFTFYSSPTTLNCLDGIRSFAMMWVIVGHTFVNQLSFIPANPLDLYKFMRAFSSLWITSATITVDTFFLISGLLLVYTTASKMTQRSLFKNLHLFYINRLLRMFPVLATWILVQASILQRFTDGPYWQTVAKSTNDCRENWWLTLLYVHNMVRPTNVCLSQTWYLAIDMQMYILSPLILFWVFGGNRKVAWTALCGALLAVIAASSVYNFINNFQSATVALSRPTEQMYYMTNYYFHTLTRAAPFLVGLCFGYLLHLCKGRTITLPKLLVAFFWLVATVVSSAIIFVTYYNIQPDWDNQTVDNILNSFMRPAWAACIGWLVFACVHGYGGPIDWVLSLHVFKVLGRLSYAMYIVHFQLIYLVNATTVQPIYFAVNLSMYRFLVDFSLATIAAFIVTIIIDIPCSTMIKLMLGAGNARKKNDDLQKGDPNKIASVIVVEDPGDIKKTRL